ncbi:helix-turn-helix transcriptional regulator [Hydrogenophaga defluvii]|uniref:Helix-turn-helix transcriptional regulator n=1 Tax=Hydrogenophaga defluvii TaxID=249410 RepID=A0ABW2SC61_9BURK
MKTTMNKVKKNDTQTLQQQITALTARVESLEAALGRMYINAQAPGDDAARSTQPRAPATAQANAEREILLMKLDGLTLKRNQIFTATLGGLSYDEIANLMQISVSTVKIQFKHALDKMGIASRQVLLTNHPHMLDPIGDAEYRKRFGVSKRWWPVNTQAPKPRPRQAADRGKSSS